MLDNSSSPMDSQNPGKQTAKSAAKEAKGRVKEIIGRNQLLASASSGLPGFRIQHYHCGLDFAYFHVGPPMRSRMQMHQHTYHEFTFVRSGSVSYFKEDRTFRLHKGEFWFMPAGVPHGWDQMSPSLVLDSFALRLSCENESIEETVASLQEAGHAVGYRLGKDATMAAVSNALWEITSVPAREPLAGDLARVRIEELVLLLFNRHLANSLKLECKNSADRPSTEGGHREVARQIISFIETHFESDLSLDALADHFHYSGHHLNRIFRQQQGMSIKNFILEARLRTARDRLLNTELPIKNIAYSLGFHDVSYFCRFFKQRTRFSPEGFREAMRGKKPISDS